MITGAASADAAVLLVDAQEGLREQTKRHCFMLSLLGLRQIVVAVNKMDLVDYRPDVFERIRTELGEFLAKLGVEPAHYVPISAKHGEGLLRHSERMPWYRGPTLLEALEKFRANPPASNGPLRLSVQDVYRFDARRIVAGLVESGSVSVGDPIEFVPGGKRSRVKSIETWPVQTPPPRGPVGAGREVAITLEDELFVERGQIGAPLDDKPYEARTFHREGVLDPRRAAALGRAGPAQARHPAGRGPHPRHPAHAGRRHPRDRHRHHGRGEGPRGR